MIDLAALRPVALMRNITASTQKLSQKGPRGQMTNNDGLNSGTLNQNDKSNPNDE